MGAIPQTHYARSSGLDIAYQVLGDAPIDLVFVHGFVSNIETSWELPELARFLRRLASFARLIVFDKRGTGLSDRVPVAELPTLEQRMDDVRAVMDAAGSERAALFGVSEGGPMSVLFAATHPQRVSRLMIYASYACRTTAEPHGGHAVIEQIEQTWGTGSVLASRSGIAADDPMVRAALARLERQCATPSAAAALIRMAGQIDVRDVLPVIAVPTLVLHRRDDRILRASGGRELAAGIPNARLIELAGGDHLAWFGDADAILDEVEEFVTGARGGAEDQRYLATVLFTDIVSSTELVARLGDRRWMQLLEGHYQAVRAELSRFRGVEIDTAGDGFLATFDGPARAIRCAQEIVRGGPALGIEIRAGVHTGEIEKRDGRIGGIAVHVGARVGALAGPSEVVTSRIVRDLVAGSGIAFKELGAHALKGVPGEWELFRVDS